MFSVINYMLLHVVVMYMYKSSFMLTNEINVFLICIKNFYTVVLFVCSSHISSTCNELLSVIKLIIE